MIELGDAEAHFPELVYRVEEGEEMLITRDGRPAALLCGIDDHVEEAELVWEIEVRLTSTAKRSGEATLCASVG